MHIPRWVGAHPSTWNDFNVLCQVLMMNRVLIYFFSLQLDISIPVRMDCKCNNNPDTFCYICSNKVFPNHQVKITDFVKKAYCDYFGVKLGIKRSHSVPTFTVKRVENLSECRNRKKKEYAICHSNVLEGRKRSYYRLLFQYDKSKRNKLQEQVPCPIPQCSFSHKINPSWFRPSCSLARL